MEDTANRPLGFVLGGLLVCGFGFWLGREGHRTSAWPTTEGRILSSEVVDTPSVDRLSHPRKFDPDREQAATVRYSYSVQGTRYVGRGVSMSTGLVPYWEDYLARSIASRYRPDDPVVVYYDPANPRLAVLEPGASLESRLALLAGCIGIVYGTLSWLRAR